MLVFSIGCPSIVVYYGAHRIEEGLPFAAVVIFHPVLTMGRFGGLPLYGQGTRLPPIGAAPPPEYEEGHSSWSERRCASIVSAMIDREPKVSEAQPVDARPAIPVVDMPSDALAEAARLVLEAVKNEETRFNNLNTRGVAVLSATSLVTALLGIFTKELVGSTLKDWGRVFGLPGLGLTIATLVVTAGIVVFGVLRPRQRMVFGNNAVTANPVAVKTKDDVLKVQYYEYRDVLESLSGRNSQKAEWLNCGYLWFAGSVLLSSGTIGVITVWALLNVPKG